MSIDRREYANYEEYVQHQKEKTSDPSRRERLMKDDIHKLRIGAFKEKFSRFTDRVSPGTYLLASGDMEHLEASTPCFKSLDEIYITENSNGKKIVNVVYTVFPWMNILNQCRDNPPRALCLGARMGEEVSALRDIGFDAIGIDLIPNPPLVIEGDFHDIKFEDNYFNFVYTNSIDHGFDLEKMFKEATRVLMPSGIFLVDFAPQAFGRYESIKIESEDDVVRCAPKEISFMNSQTFLGTGSPAPGFLREMYFVKEE
jgi:SAM-dependent methyltransferase